MRRRFRLFSVISPVLLAALGAQAIQPFHLPSRTPAPSGVRSEMAAGSPRFATAAESAMGGPTVSRLRKAFPGRNLVQVGHGEFRNLVAAHAGRGRLLAGPALAAALEAGPEASAGTAPEGDAESGAEPQRGPTDSSRPADAIAPRPRPDTGGDSAFAGARALRESQAKSAARRDSLHCDSLHRIGDAEAYRRFCTAGSPVLLPGETARTYEADETDVEEARAQAYLGNLLVDVSNSGPASLDDGEPWAAIIFVVVGVVVVGAFVLYGFHTLYELAVNEADYPVFVEAGARFSHSEKAWRDGEGADLYRNANLAGMRFAIGLDRPGVGLGLSLEAGYIDVSLHGLDDPSRTFGFNGGYFMAGPMLRFGRNAPYSFSLEFLNGASNHASIGWISKSRMTLARKFGSHFLLGAHLGAVFYELEFLDGLAWRRGSFNRDLSLVYGLDTGWDF